VTVDVRLHDLLHDGAAPVAPTVVANLLGPLLRRMAADGFAGGELPRALVVSGLLVEEADGVAAAFARRGVRERTRRTEGQWAALLLAA
jgi:ribosomal protein L11 methyltransferase